MRIYVNNAMSNIIYSIIEVWMFDHFNMNGRPCIQGQFCHYDCLSSCWIFPQMAAFLSFLLGFWAPSCLRKLKVLTLTNALCIFLFIITQAAILVHLSIFREFPSVSSRFSIAKSFCYGSHEVTMPLHGQSLGNWTSKRLPFLNWKYQFCDHKYQKMFVQES